MASIPANSSKAVKPPAGAPHTAYKEAQRTYFESVGGLVVDRARYFTIIIMLFLVVMALCTTIVMILPLKQTIPFVIEVQDDGRVEAKGTVASKYTPGQREKHYFIARFVTKLVTLNRNLSDDNLQEVKLFVRDKAVDEFFDFIKKEQPIKAVLDDPTLTRTVDISSVSFVSDRAALVRYTTESRSSANPNARRERRIATIHYELVPVKNERELMVNPIGIYITHFSLNEDLEAPSK